MRRIVIIGNGIAGITAARHIRKRSNDPVLVISAETDHFFSRTALMYIYMGHMAYENTKPYENAFWSKNRIELMRAYVQKVDVAAKQLHLGDGRNVAYDVLIIASGSRSNKFGWPGQDLAGVQGLYSLPDLETMERYTSGIERAVVIGGGLIGVEMAEMLHSRGIGVTFLVREASWMSHILPPEESAMINRHLREHHVDLRLSTELDRIEGDDEGRVRAALTKDGDEIPCQFLGLTVGVSPNIGFLAESDVETQRGVLVDDHLRTSAPDVYAIGDCAQLREPRPGRRPIEPLWYTGRMMGETVARIVCGDDRAYDPGIWFNSAKFFDIEYQIYGDVPTETPTDIESLYWEHPDGRAALRLNFRPADRVVTGFHLMGIRYRHETCEDWLRAGATIDEVLPNLGAANFDPEFYKQYESDLIALYNERYPDRPIRQQSRRGLAGWLRLRKAS